MLRTTIVAMFLGLFVVVAAEPAFSADDLEALLDEEVLTAVNKTFTGDYDQMVENRLIRVLIPYSRTFFFFDGARPRGASYEAVKEFEEIINAQLKTGNLKVHVLVIPTAREDLIPQVRDGRGDLAVGNLTITDERLKDVDFSNPLVTGVDEILVSNKGAEKVASLFDMGGKTVHARASSSYYSSLVRLNETLRSLQKPEVRIAEADDNLEDEDLLEMVNAGLIDYTVIDGHKGALWAQVFDRIELHPDIKLRSGGSIGWVLRKNNPKLKAKVNEFIKTHKAGTLFGNIILKRYLGNADYITDEISTKHRQRFSETVQFFKKYGDQYRFDHLMLAALAYQESKLDQNLKSRVGAVGVMQVLPTTALDRNVGIPDIDRLEPNIHAGTKYLRFMTDTYFADDSGLDVMNRTLFAFASYNAGPAKVARMRKEAKRMGLDPNKWFRNVEIVAAKQIGRETVQYVSNIFKYYLAYRLMAEKLEGVPADAPTGAVP